MMSGAAAFDRRRDGERAKVVVSLLSSLTFSACGQEIVPVRPPFEGDGFLVRERPGAPREVLRLVAGAAFSFEAEEGEEDFLVSYDQAELLRRHPEAVVSDPSAVGLYFSSVTAGQCPFGEAPAAWRRAYLLPDEAWTVHRLSGDRLEPISDGPAWRSSLRVEAPIAPGCGLREPVLETLDFFPTRGKGFDNLVPLGGTRWVGVTTFGTALVLMDTSPPRVLFELRRVEDLGYREQYDDFSRLEVDVRSTPPIVLLATSHGLFRFRVEGDELVLVDQSFEEHDLLDLQLDPSGPVLAVSGRGLVLSATVSTGRLSGSQPLGEQRLERIRRTRSDASPYMLFATRGRIYYGDPFSAPAELEPVDPTVRGWADVTVRPVPAAPLSYALDAAGTLHRLDGGQSFVSTRVALPPELEVCAGPVLDACGFRPIEPAVPRSVVILDEPSPEAPMLLIGFQDCRAVAAVEPNRGCIAPLLGPEVLYGPGTRWARVTEDAIYYPSLIGPVFRWSRDR